jgi:hypothetical protein
LKRKEREVERRETEKRTSSFGDPFVPVYVAPGNMIAIAYDYIRISSWLELAPGDMI